jgi:hypothetical protein
MKRAGAAIDDNLGYLSPQPGTSSILQPSTYTGDRDIIQYSRLGYSDYDVF